MNHRLIALHATLACIPMAFIPLPGSCSNTYLYRPLSPMSGKERRTLPIEADALLCTRVFRVSSCKEQQHSAKAAHWVQVHILKTQEQHLASQGETAGGGKQGAKHAGNIMRVVLLDAMPPARAARTSSFRVSGTWALRGGPACRARAVSAFGTNTVPAEALNCQPCHLCGMPKMSKPLPNGTIVAASNHAMEGSCASTHILFNVTSVLNKARRADDWYP